MSRVSTPTLPAAPPSTSTDNQSVGYSSSNIQTPTSPSHPPAVVSSAFSSGFYAKRKAAQKKHVPPKLFATVNGQQVPFSEYKM